MNPSSEVNLIAFGVAAAAIGVIALASWIANRKNK